MIKVIFIKNPFSFNRDRVVKLSEVTGKALSFYIGEFIEQLPEQKAWVQVNGRTYQSITDNDIKQIVPDNAFVMVMPVVGKGGGKNPFALIASIALSVVAMGVGNLIAGGAFFTAGGATWGFMSYLGAAATMFLGGQLVSKFTAPKIDAGKYEMENPTYSWNGVQTMEGQGNCIPIVYGTVKSGGQSIVKFTTNNGDDQYFNWLVCACEGPATISDIKLNDNPIENYEEVIVDVRPGTNEQDCIDNFNDTVQSKALSYELNNNEWRTDVTDGNSTEGIIIDVECSNGLYHANDNGSLGTAWVDVKAECALEGTEDWITIASGSPALKHNNLGAVLTYSTDIGTYTVSVSFDTDKYVEDEDGNRESNPYYNMYRIRVAENTGKWYNRKYYYAYFSPGEIGNIDAGPFRFDKATMEAKGSGYSTTLEVFQSGRISGAKAGPVRRQFRVDHLPVGKYKVRVTVTARSASVNSSRDGVRTYWTMLSSVIYEDFSYPTRALIGIKAKATSQLSGSTPKLTFLVTRSSVWVWNARTLAFEEKPANNPAWAAYDYVCGIQRLKNIHTGEYEFEIRGVPVEYMIYDQFEAWAENCELMDLQIDIVMTNPDTFLQSVNKEIASVGRGMVLQFGTKYGCVYDHKSQPVQLFNMGNIIAGSFELSYLSTDDRANSVELTFSNRDKEYERDTIVAYGDGYDTQDIISNPTQITMNGITRYDQAYRELIFQLHSNQKVQQFVTFKAELEAIGCMVGDQVLIAHDVPQWSLSGRIERVDGNSVVMLALDPDEITLQANEYALMIRTINNNIYTYPVASVSGNYGSVFVTVAGTFSAEDMPQANDLFALGKVNATAKPFIIRSITRDNDLVRTISAMQYVEGLFDEDYDIPQPDYSLAENNEAVNVINLQAYQIAYKNKAGTQLCKMFASWQLPEGTFADYFTVLLSNNNGLTYRVADTTMTMEIELDTQPFTEYYVKVVTNVRVKQSSGTVYGPVSAGIDVPPPDVTLLNHEELADGTRRLYVEFEYPNPNDVAGFIFRYNQGSFITWDTAVPLHTGVVTEQPFETKALRHGVHTVMVKAVDNAGQESVNVAYALLNLGDPLEDNVLYRVKLSDNNWGLVVHDGVLETDGSITAQSNVAFWLSPESPMWVNPDTPFWFERYGAFALDFLTIAPASGQLWLKYDITGPAKIEYRVVGNNPFWDSPDTPMWDEESYAFWVDDESMFKPYTGKVLVKAGDQLQVHVTAPENVYEETIVKDLMLVIDVPDRQEHFEDIYIPEEGLLLPITTPNPYTINVHLDAVQGNNVTKVKAEIITKNPCKVRLIDENNNPIAATADITWQGFIKEEL